MLCIRPFAGSCNNGAATGDGGSGSKIVIRAVRKFHTNLYIDYDTRLQIICSVTGVLLNSAVNEAWLRVPLIHSSMGKWSRIAAPSTQLSRTVVVRLYIAVEMERELMAHGGSLEPFMIA